MGRLDRLKWWLGGVIQRDPYSQFLAKKLLLRLPFLLPHDRSYLGIRRLPPHPNRLIVDVGANDGISALGFRQLDTRSRILSIEPSAYHAASIERLKRRIPDFDYLLAAAGDEPGELELFTAFYRGIPLHTGASLCLEQTMTTVRETLPPRVFRKAHYKRQRVQVLRLDDLELEPSLVKIDAEGSDHKVLLGLKHTIEKHRPALLVELKRSTEPEIRSFCRGLAYSLFRYDEVTDRLLPFDGAEVRNIFCLPDEAVLL